MKYLLDQQELDDLKNADVVTIAEVVKELKKHLVSELTILARREYLSGWTEQQTMVRLKDLQASLERFNPNTRTRT